MVFRLKSTALGSEIGSLGEVEKWKKDMLVMKIDTSNILQSLVRWFQNSETAVFVSFISFCGCGSGTVFIWEVLLFFL